MLDTRYWILDAGCFGNVKRGDKFLGITVYVSNI